MKKTRRRILSCVTAAMLLSSCAHGPAEHIVTPAIRPTSVLLAQGAVVRIELAADSRSFEQRPRVASISSLPPDQYGKPEIQARAIGRMRDAMGHAEEALLLPQGQTVSGLFRDATAGAFRAAGYRVAAPDDPAYAQAAPVTVTIRDYWNWVAMGTRRHIECRAEAGIRAPFGPFANSLVVSGTAATPEKPASPPDGLTRDDMENVHDADWRAVSGACLAAYADNLKAMLAR